MDGVIIKTTKPLEIAYFQLILSKKVPVRPLITCKKLLKSSNHQKSLTAACCSYQ